MPVIARPTTVGLNVGEDGPITVSQDVCYAGAKPDWANLQTTLASPHVAGSGVFELANWKVAYRDFEYEGTYNGSSIVPIRLLGAGGAVITVVGTLIAGTPFFHATGFIGGADQAWPAGTPVDRADGWANASASPADRVLAPPLVVGGRDTGYPAGLNPGQTAGWQCQASTTLHIPAGDYQPRGVGTGQVKYGFRFRDPAVPDVGVVVTFTNGVPSPSVVTVPSDTAQSVTLDLMASSPADPIHDVRLFKPGTAAAYDAFNDTSRTLYDPDILQQLRDGGAIRVMDIQRINFSRQGATWTAEQEAVNRRIIAWANAADVDVWANLPHQATDAYIEALAALYDAELAPGRRWYLEHSNEVWNGSFIQNTYAGEAGAATYSPLVARSLVSDGATVTAYRPAHGLATGTTCVVEGASDDRYNGEYAVTVVDADHVTYAPATPPPAGSAVARGLLQPLVLFDPTTTDSVRVSSADWTWDAPGDDGNGPRFTYNCPDADAPDKVFGQEVAMVTGCAQPAGNILFRSDRFHGDDPTKIWQYAGLQGRHTPLPPYSASGPAALTPAPGRTMRVTPLSGDARPHQRLRTDLVQQWHALRTYQAGEIAHAASPTKFRGVILGAWAGSAGNAPLMDDYLAVAGGAVPSGYGVFVAIAPYLYGDDPYGMTQERMIDGLLGVASVVASGGVATVSGPYTIPGVSSPPTVPNHGLVSGQQVNITNAYPADYCGPVTVTVTSPTTFTYPLPAGSNPASPAQAFAGGGIRVTPMPSWGREVVAFTRSGTTFTLTSPRHGFAPGDPICVGGFGFPEFDGEYAVGTVPTPDTFTIDRPGTTYSPVSPTDPASGYRPWAFSRVVVDRFMDTVQHFLDGQFPRGMVDPHAADCAARGMIPVVYEFSAGYGPTAPYYSYEPVDLIFQAANRTARLGPMYDQAYARFYAKGYDLIQHYGHCNTMSVYGSFAAREWPTDDSVRWAAIQRARARFGHAMDAGPSFDLTPTHGESSTPENVVAVGAGTAWDNSTTATATGGTLANFAVVDATHATFRLVPSATPGLATVTIGGADRTVVVYEPALRSFYLDLPYLRAGETRAGVPFSGVGTAWGGATAFTATGGATVSAASIASATAATATIAAPATPGRVTLDDGQGTTLTLPVVVETIVDFGDPGYAEATPWSGTGSGLAGIRYHGGGGNAADGVTWSMGTASVAGAYGYAADWVEAPDRASNATYTVTVNGAVVATHVVDQRKPSLGGVVAGDRLFQLLGSVPLAIGDTLAVTLSGAGDGYLIADAVRFWTEGSDAPAPVLIVDDGDPLVAGAGYAQTGTWNSSGSGFGGDSRYASGADDVAAVATWQAPAPRDGTYGVYASWGAGNANNAASAPYRVLVDGVAVASVAIDQRVGSRGPIPAGAGAGLQLIGRASATAGQILQVELTGRGGTFIQADAAQFALEGPPAVATPATGFTLTGPASLASGATGTYTVAPSGGALAADAAVALDDGGHGGTLTPASLAFLVGATAGQTFTYHGPSGTATLTATPTPALGTPPTKAVAIAAPAQSMTVSPTTATAGASASLVTFTGTNTAWGGSTTATLSGGTGASLTGFAASSATAATATLNPGSAAGTLTLTIGSLAATVTVNPAALVAGTISFGTPTQTTVSVTLGGTSGGVAPYSIQFQRAPDASGSPGTFANVGTAGTGTTFSATGLTAGTKYWFRAVVTPASGSPATSAAASVTTAAAPTGGGVKYMLILKTP